MRFLRLRLLCAAALLFAVGFVLAPACAAGPKNPVAPRGRVYLIRGQGWVFSAGWAILRDRLRAAGVRAEDVSDLDGTWVGDDVLADHRAGKLRGPIVFVGHSRGGRQALRAAERLRREGVNIDLILTADVAAPPPVPANVGRAVNLYLTKKRVYPARPLRAAKDSKAIIENVALDGPDSPIEVEGLHHLNITDNREVRNYAYKRIMQVMRKAD